MGDSHEGRKSGFMTRPIRERSHNRAPWICSCGALLCLVIILIMRLNNSGGNPSDVFIQLLENVLFTLFAALTVGFAWELLGKDALSRELQQHTDKILRHTGLSNALADQGILHTTTDFEHKIPWEKYIADADEIDVCWWAGSGWIRGNADAIEKAIQARQVRIRYAIPNPYDENVLFLMGALSGVTHEELQSEYIKASQELRSLGEAAELHNLKKLPQYGMVRLGHRIIFFPYSHLKDRPKNRPTFVIDANSEIGGRFLRDFEDLLRANEESSPSSS